MKKIVLVFAFLPLATLGYSQKYMDKIADKACICLEKFKDNVVSDQLTFEFGLCMIEAAMPYKKQLKKDYGIDMDRIDVDGESLGRVVGIKMATSCPNLLYNMATLFIGEEEQQDDVVTKDVKNVKGIISKIDSESFVVFSLKDDAGKTLMLHWFNHIDCDVELTEDYSSLVGKSVSVSYEIHDLFDPKLAQYRPYYVISRISLN
jgi:hypothetical protein